MRALVIAYLVVALMFFVVTARLISVNCGETNVQRAVLVAVGWPAGMVLATVDAVTEPEFGKRGMSCEP